jgi:hypothetical protein
MAVDPRLDLRLAGSPVDHAADYATAFNLGRDLAMGLGPGANPQGPPTPPPPPTQGGSSGVSEAIRRMTPDQRARAAETNEQLGAILQGLRGLTLANGTPDLAHRFSAAQHIARQTGLMNPASITMDDISDTGLAHHAAAVRAIRDRIASSSLARPARGSGPRPGDLEGGRRFLGGDPANPSGLAHSEDSLRV